MIRWLHVHIFRGIGIVFVAGVITFLLLDILSVTQHGRQSALAAPVHASR